MMQISRSTTSQRCSIGLRSGDYGGHLSKVNSLSCSRNQSEMIWAILSLAHLAPTTIPCSKSLKSPFFPILMLGLIFSKSSSPHLQLLTCDWLISNLCYQAIEQLFLIKWPVSVLYICVLQKKKMTKWKKKKNIYIYIYIKHFFSFSLFF